VVVVLAVVVVVVVEGVGFDDVAFGNDDDESDELLDDDAGVATTDAIFGVCIIVVTVCLDMGLTLVLAVYLVATLSSKVEASTSTLLLSVEIAALFELIFLLPLLLKLVRRSAKDDSHLLLPDDDDDFDTLVGDEIMLVAVITAASDASPFCSPEQEEERWGRFKLVRGGDIICGGDE
jgi:hypothetical protein